MPPMLFDPSLRRIRLARSGRLFRDADFLHRRAAEDLAERVVELRDRPDRALIFGDRGGWLRARLQERGWPVHGDLLIEGEPLSAEAGSSAAAPASKGEQPPFGVGAFGLVLSILSLHWANDLVGALVQARRALQPGGAMIASLLGGATLGELRQALLRAEAELRGGAGPRVSPMLDPADAPALMRRAGFVDSIVEVDRLTVRYVHLLALLADLRAMGETNTLVERARRPLSRAVITRAQALYAKLFAEPDGRLPASFEIITLTGWAGAPSAA